jgi:hypothetical protein
VAIVENASSQAHTAQQTVTFEQWIPGAVVGGNRVVFGESLGAEHAAIDRVIRVAAY